MASISSNRSDEIGPISIERADLLKWSEERGKTPNPVHVTLFIDSNSFHLVCVNKFNKTSECFDLVLIHDTRTGSFVSLPPGTETCKEVNYGSLNDSLKSKWLTIVYGNSFVPNKNLRFLHFIFFSKEMAKKWSDTLFTASRSARLRNISAIESIEKFYSKTFHEVLTDRLDENEIPVENFIQYICKNDRSPEKRKRILNALETSDIVNKQDQSFPRTNLTFDRFFRFFRHLTDLREIDGLFKKLTNGNRHEINCQTFHEFLKKQDNIYFDESQETIFKEKIDRLIEKFNKTDSKMSENALSKNSFIRYLMSVENPIIDRSKFEMFMEMDRPLAEYFIASSHNTYLIANQFVGHASVEMYRQVLLAGCRCIELDVFDSEQSPLQPEIKHQNTPIRSVPFCDVLTAISECAFKVTSYPLILSFENHCSPPVQKMISQNLIDVFGESLLKEPLPTHPCAEGCRLPSPKDLQYKILIKNKKIETKTSPNISNKVTTPTVTKKFGFQPSASSDSEVFNNSSILRDHRKPTLSKAQDSGCYTQDNNLMEGTPPLDWALDFFDPFCSRGKCSDPDEDFSDEEDLANYPSDVSQIKFDPIDGTKLMLNETEAISELSNLVVYTVPTPLKSLKELIDRRFFYQMISQSETRAQTLISRQAKDFLDFNRNHLTRIYPRGTRFNSSNFFPHSFWSVGCQLVALNYQKPDVPMQLNLGFFSFNGNCGYILKPKILCDSAIDFDPKTSEQTNIRQNLHITLKIFFGQFLFQDVEPSFLFVKLFGIDADSAKKNEHKISTRIWNGFKAVYGERQGAVVEFAKIVCPELAAIHISALDHNEKFIGQCLLPVTYLQTGYRWIVLRNAINLPVTFSSLYVKIERHVNEPTGSRSWNNSYTMKSPSKDPFAKQPNDSTRHGPSLSTKENLSQMGMLRIHSSATKSITKQASQSILDTKPAEFQVHLIASSKFETQKDLLKMISIDQIENEETRRNLRKKLENLRRPSSSLEKKIQKEQKLLSKLVSISNRENCKKHYSFENETSPELKQCRMRLIELYQKQFNSEKELELEEIKSYYNALLEKLNAEYQKKKKELEDILKKEQSRLQQELNETLNREISEMKRKITDNEKSMIEVEKIKSRNYKAADTVEHFLKSKFTEMSEIIQENFTRSIEELESQRSKENELCIEKFDFRFEMRRNHLDPEGANSTIDNESA